MAERSCKKCFHYKACKEVASHSGYGDIYYTENQCKHFISTADVVEVVRCKDCKNFCPYEGEEHKGDCAELVGLESCVYEDDFCSYGEKALKEREKE
jgi:hypothetical protein